MNSMNRQKDRTLKEELPRLVGAQYTTEEDGAITLRRVTNQSQGKSNTQLCM